MDEREYTIRDTDILFVIDMQKDFIDGALGSKDAMDIVPNVKTLIDRFRVCNRKVVLTMDTHSGWEITIEASRISAHCIQPSSGWGIYDSIAKSAGTGRNVMYIKKEGFMADMKKFVDEEKIMRDVERIFICGLCTDICVVSNALALRKMCPSNEIVCVTDCCAGTSVEAHQAALTVMRSCLVDTTTLDKVHCIAEVKSL